MHRRNEQRRSASTQKHESASSAHQLLPPQKTRAATLPTKLPEGKDEDAVEGTASLDRATSNRPPVRHMQLLRANSSTQHTPQSPAPYSFRRKNPVSVVRLHQTHKRNLFVSHKDPQEVVDEASLQEEATVLRQVRQHELAEASVMWTDLFRVYILRRGCPLLGRLLTRNRGNRERVTAASGTFRRASA